MALNVTKLIYSKAHRLMAIHTGTNLNIRQSHTGNSFRECEKDCYTNRCGLRRLKEPACKPCDRRIRSDPKDPERHGKQWTPDNAKSRFAYAFKEKDAFNECCEMGHLSRPPCSDSNRFGFKLHVPKTAWQMLHWKPECCPCLPETPRFDEVYYRIRKMCEKEYFPTWAECPKPRIVPKIVCCYDKEPIEVPRRIRCKPPQTACPLPEDAINKKLLVCKVGGDPNCVKVFTPCCCPARNPPKCLRIRQPLCAGRLEVPSPSFSECCKGSPNSVKPSECRCYLVEPLCGYPPLPPKPIRTC